MSLQMRTVVRVLALVLSGVPAIAAVAEGLEGSAWRLLTIAGMDDSMAMADDPNKYTLSFAAEGKVTIMADCNRGRGSWASASPGQLEFGPIASTRALCPPPSLSEQYLAQFEWVRSYIMRDGHLFLATMADGAIIEFEPLPPAVATVFGAAVHAADVTELQGRLFSPLFDRYAAEQGITVEESELATYLDTMRRGMAAEGLTAGDDLTPEEAREIDAMRRSMGEGLIRQWKINRSLFETYGGRVAYQQLGPEPLDAYRKYFEARQAAGDFTLEDPAMAKQFWQYFGDTSRHDFMEPGSADAARAFTVPPWERMQ
jgi:heat shock protein HslJ